MARLITLDEIHLIVLIPRGLPPSEVDAIRHLLNAPGFEARLRRAIKRTFRRENSLRSVKVRLRR